MKENDVMISEITMTTEDCAKLVAELHAHFMNLNEKCAIENNTERYNDLWYRLNATKNFLYETMQAVVNSHNLALNALEAKEKC